MLGTLAQAPGLRIASPATLRSAARSNRKGCGAHRRI